MSIEDSHDLAISLSAGETCKVVKRKKQLDYLFLYDKLGQKDEEKTNLSKETATRE